VCERVGLLLLGRVKTVQKYSMSISHNEL
jgi:hypothetical protein